MRRSGVIAVLCAALLGTGCTRTEIFDLEAVITDPVFMEYCLTATDMDGNLRIDLDGNGVITRREAALVEEIYLDNEGGNIVGDNKMPGVQSLAGIEYFTGLRRLSVGNNSLTTLDISRNTLLTYLNCSDNRITSLQLPAGSRLETLNCNGNGFSSLNISVMPSLKYLYCTRNAITQLDVSGNPAIVELSCDRNDLKTLDVSGCSDLTDLSCAGNGLTSLVLPENSSLVRLDCGTHEQNGRSRENELRELDLKGQDKLSLLRVNANPLTALDISECASLRTLECAYCDLDSLDITSNTRLRSLFCNKMPDDIKVMKIYVPPGFDPSRFLSWVIGTATVEERS